MIRCNNLFQYEILEKGFSLIELLVALALNLFLLLGILTVYHNQIYNYQFTQELGRLQDNARILSQYLAKDIWQAGYIGCGRFSEVQLHTSFAEVNPDNIFKGFSAGVANENNPTALNKIINHAAKDSDILWIQEAGSQNISGNFREILPTTQKLVIANCTQATIVSAKTNSYSGDCQDQVSPWLSLVYYLADTGRKNREGDKIYALYRRDLNAIYNRHAELVEGVEQFKINYGIYDVLAQQLQYVPAEEVLDWQKVVSVKIALVLSSLEGVLSQPPTKENSDRRLRRKLNLVFSLRERI